MNDRHGTWHGKDQHRAENTPVCNACRIAWNEYKINLRKKKDGQVDFLTPSRNREATKYRDAALVNRINQNRKNVFYRA